MKRLTSAAFLIFAVMLSSVAYADLKGADRKLNDLYSQVINSLPTEPHRIYRRPFGLSYAAIAGASSMA